MNSHSVDVWTIHLDSARRVILTPEEQARAARFRFEGDRLHWTHARSALREILGAYVATPPEAIQFTYGPNGKPSTRGIEFNLSHARNRAMIAVSRDVPVGIDIESIRENVEIGKLLGRIGETETAGSTEQLFQRWTRREARTKALGWSLMELPPPNVIAIDLEAPPGFAASAALVDHLPSVHYCGRPE